MRTTSPVHRSAFRVGLVALVLLFAGVSATGTAIANPGAGGGLAPGGNGPPPPEPPPPGPQDDAVPPPPPPPPHPAPPGGGGSGSSGGSGAGSAGDGVVDGDVVPSAAAPVDGTPGKESDRPTTGLTEVASGPELVADTEAAVGAAWLLALGLVAFMVAGAAGLFLVVWRRSTRDRSVPATF